MRTEDEVRIANAERAAVDISARTRKSVDRIQLVVRALAGVSCVACVLGIWALWDSALAAGKGWMLVMLVGGIVGQTGVSIGLARRSGLEKHPRRRGDRC